MGRDTGSVAEAICGAVARAARRKAARAGNRGEAKPSRGPSGPPRRGKSGKHSTTEVEWAAEAKPFAEPQSERALARAGNCPTSAEATWREHRSEPGDADDFADDHRRPIRAGDRPAWCALAR